MISKDILGYKLGTAKDELTPYAGLALLGEFSSGLGLLDLLSNQMSNESILQIRKRTYESVMG